MRIASQSRRPAGSVVALRQPLCTSLASSVDSTSSTYDVPAFTEPTFSALTSTPSTSTPVSANAAARGSPTYPSPMIPTRVTVADDTSAGSPTQTASSRSASIGSPDGRPADDAGPSPRGYPGLRPT